MSVTLPHERELLGIVQLAFDAMTAEQPFLAVVITDSSEHVRWIINKLHDATRWDDKTVKLFREGIETSEGGKIVVKIASHPEGLMGLRPDRIILMGRLGELFYNVLAMNREIEVIA